jgi:hypothetical protein
MAKRSKAEKEWESNIVDCNDCKTERGEGRWIMTGDGRRTKEKQDIIKDYNKDE